MALSNYIMRKRTLDDINVMRDDSLRLPENLMGWSAMIGILREEAKRIRRKKELDLPKKQYQQWYEGFSIYRQALEDRKAEAIFLIKEQNIIKARNKNQTEQSIMFRAVHQSLDFIKVGEIEKAQSTLEECVEQIKAAKTGASNKEFQIERMNLIKEWTSGAK